MTTVAVTPRGFRRTKGEHLNLLRSTGWAVRWPSVDRVLTEGEMVVLLRGCEGAIVGLDPVTERVLRSPLRVLVRFGTGVDNVDLEAAQRAGVAISRTPGANARAVAELAIALMLALVRQVPWHDRSSKTGAWERMLGVELGGRQLGLVGIGAVGRETGRLASAIGMNVVGYDPAPALESSIVRVSFDELLATSDIVSIHAPFTPSSSGLLSTGEFERMKPGAYLVNTARGGIVDEDALFAALTEGHLAGAALDCFATEPPSDNRLLRLDSVIATPHIGASTNEAVERSGVMAVRELIRGLRGDPLEHQVLSVSD